jgi:hypothetical protein
MISDRYGPAPTRRAASPIPAVRIRATQKLLPIRSVEMNLMHEDLARAQMRERYRQARDERLSHLVARVRKARRSAAAMARLPEHADAEL